MIGAKEWVCLDVHGGHGQFKSNFIETLLAPWKYFSEDRCHIMGRSMVPHMNCLENTGTWRFCSRLKNV